MIKNAFQGRIGGWKDDEWRADWIEGNQRNDFNLIQK
jgi:hypothetical protein